MGAAAISFNSCVGPGAKEARLAGSSSGGQTSEHCVESKDRHGGLSDRHENESLSCTALPKMTENFSSKLLCMPKYRDLFFL